MKKLNIHIIAALFAALLIFAAAPAVFAVDIDYSGDIDASTYEPVISPAGSSSKRISISDSLYYDTSTMKYVYPVDNTLIEISSSAADGMVLSESVYVSSTDPSVVVFCNGSECTGDLTNLREVGDYVVSVRSGGTSIRVFDFSIVGATTNALRQFQVPDGFYINSATRDGEDVYQDRYHVNMEEEGLYEIEYECGLTSRKYWLETTVDRTPPALTFQAKIDSKQRIHSALSFSGLEDGDTIYLLKDAVEVQPKLNNDGTGQILDPGNYIMRVYDAAGNMKEYSFTIMMYLSVSSWLFFLLVLAVILAVVVYVMIKRKKLKIG